VTADGPTARKIVAVSGEAAGVAEFAHVSSPGTSWVRLPGTGSSEEERIGVTLDVYRLVNNLMQGSGHDDGADG
jgi:hypothetical protein